MSARKQSKRARFSAEIKQQRRINRSLFAIRQQLKHRRGRSRVMEQFRQALDRYGFRHQRRQFEAPERMHSQVQPLRIWIDECAAIDPRVWANL